MKCEKLEIYLKWRAIVVKLHSLILRVEPVALPAAEILNLDAALGPHSLFIELWEFNDVPSVFPSDIQ